ncbi:MAG TPA: STAS domain-containing protein [Candidatus Acidoferrales bacterium]|nr:STAS domain-containing protein [Candidatus Acidoferrales bacterium]
MNSPTDTKTRIPELLKRDQSAILQDWARQQRLEGTRGEKVPEAEWREQSRALLEAIAAAAQSGRIDDVTGPEWNAVRDMLSEVAQARAKAGFTQSQTARFVFSLKQTLFPLLQREFQSDLKSLTEETWAASTLIDNLGLMTTEAYLKAREAVVTRQQQELLELSTPVVKLWDGIVAVPLIGTLDSQRTQIVMESLLQQVVDTGASIAIIDITGVPTVDTLVAQHLLKTVAAARLMGTDCIISGIRPQIAATIVHLGVDLGSVITKATLADAFRLALRRLGLGVRALPGNSPAKEGSPVKEGHGTDSNS